MRGKSLWLLLQAAMELELHSVVAGDQLSERLTGKSPCSSSKPALGELRSLLTDIHMEAINGDS